eukprot:TRINITY_DN3749_c0_g2_i1.p1 TRINITY_DN3749_c0_g2~~TRINITY_DN3749_c0_g2_i1.p1  ORF type:complete len:355 (+),score=104.77 TRINITY_DN3749_c0_g2_i1:72-1136(+)
MSLGVCAVIGGGGWLGSNLVEQLVAEPGVAKPVRSYDVAPARENFPTGAAEHSKLDMRDAAAVDDALKGVDTVFCVAAIIDIRLFPDPICRQVNVDGCANVIAACKKNGVKRLIHTSTLDVVGGGLHNADETGAYCDRTISVRPLYVAHPDGYYRTKAQGERMVKAADSDELLTVALRMTHIFGIGDDVCQLASDSPVGTGGASARASMVDVANGAAAHVQAAKQLLRDPAPVRGKAFFITDFDANFSDLYRSFAGLGPPVVRIPFFVMAAVALLLEIIAAVVYLCCCRTRMPWVRSGKLTFGLAALDGMRIHTVNGQAARKAFNYTPPVSQEQSIENARKWYLGTKSASRKLD